MANLHTQDFVLISRITCLWVSILFYGLGVYADLSNLNVKSTHSQSMQLRIEVLQATVLMSSSLSLHDLEEWPHFEKQPLTLMS